MVKPKRIRAPEIPFARFLVFLFVLAVGGALYYSFGGPIPYTVQFSGPEGTAFEGRYTISDELVNTSVEGSEAFQATYPHTVRLWAPSYGGVVASAESVADADVLSTVTVRRAGVVCAEAYRWGRGVDAVCAAP